MSIPVISPIEVTLSRSAGARLLPSSTAGEEIEPDYTVQELSPAALPAPDPVAAALDEIERATAVSEYHDFEWWKSRLSLIRTALEARR